MSSGAGPGGGGGNGNFPPYSNGSGNWTGVVLTLILSLLIAIALVILLYIGAWCLLKRSSARRRSRINQLINDATIMRTHPHEVSTNINSGGLHPSVIDSLPTLAYRELNNNQNDHKNGSSRECAVCLSLFQDEEMIRLLPNCKHFFHPDCINRWLRSNTTCPICRCSTTTTTQSPALPVEAEPPHRSYEMGSVVVPPPSLPSPVVVIER